MTLDIYTNTKGQAILDAFDVIQQWLLLECILRPLSGQTQATERMDEALNILLKPSQMV